MRTVVEMGEKEQIKEQGSKGGKGEREDGEKEDISVKRGRIERPSIRNRLKF